MSRYSSQWIKVSEPSPHILLVELARSPANAFCTEFWVAYRDLFASLANDRYDVRALVLSSVFPKYFSASLDLEEASDLSSNANRDGARASLAKKDMILAFQAALGSVEKATYPVIAAVHGHCIGIGVDMIGPCDIRYSASNAKFSIKFTYTSPEKLGLVSKVVEGGRDEVVKEALNVAQLIASQSPVAISGSKALLTHSRDHPTAENLVYTALWNSVALDTNDIQDRRVTSTKKKRVRFASLNLPEGKSAKL
ncbi:Delta2-dienoyl-CoA-isomerase [Gymnopilus junonius]|uniref:Delta2-dienoyl-CoA-isomerase n=1 Tax=Gymnopilus junonius TaxID=109634 RepID=A0A9P5TL59_GYMJU|nr:Delta2-dienoyl-CoA-isomerase [Gymnopilus junonius]